VNRAAPAELSDVHVRLVPPAHDLAAGLFACSRDPEVWRYSLTRPFASVAEAAAFLEERRLGRERGGELAFVAIARADGAVAGTTRLYDIDPTHASCSLGWTWYGAAYRRTAINTATKLLLLRHAFEALRVNRVQFTIDARNVASLAAVERIGATREGVLRRHRLLPDGFVRDTVVYAITHEEYPRVRAALRRRLADR